MSSTDAGLAQRATALGRLLHERRASVCTAESCTGGWIAKTFTDIAGSSDWFGFGLVTYSNEAKQTLLGVSADVLAEHGAVSREVVEQMATGVLSIAHANLAISVSGVAGPGGGTAQKPVGTVWFGVACGGVFAPEHKDLRSECRLFSGDRDAVRRATVAHAIDMLLNTLTIPL